MYLVDEENIYLRAFELESNFVLVLSYASRGKLGPIIEGLRYGSSVPTRHERVTRYRIHQCCLQVSISVS